MLLLALSLPPLALYLLILGWINRRPRPVMAAGTWDFAGILFALSGFLLFGGPALLGSLDEQSRWFWLLGQPGATKAGAGDGWPAWFAVRLLYVAVVAGAAAFALWRGRRLTSVYNVDPRSVFPALAQAFQRLGVQTLRGGNGFLIGGAPAPAFKGKDDGIQTSPLPAAAPAGPGMAVHVDVFPLMRHVTLRWEPADAPLRRDLERELARTFAEAAPADPDSIVGGAISLLGVTLLILAFVAGGLLLLLRFYPPR